MDKLAESLINPYILVYFLVVVGAQLLYGQLKWIKQKQLARRRQRQGLPSDVLMDSGERLSDRRREALIESGLLLFTILIVPFILIWLSGFAAESAEDAATTRQGLVLAFLALILGFFYNATDAARAFLGGLAFRILAAFKQPFQMGDRVTVKDISGKVVGFDTFFITLQTANDDQVSIPTHTLWSETLNSANAGERSSLCVMKFYLAPTVTAEQRQAVEDVIWNAIQSSAYFEPAKSMQIYLSQSKEAVELTAKAYVALTYNEALFSSDVYRAYFNFISNNNIELTFHN